MSAVSILPAERARNFVGEGFQHLKPDEIRRTFTSWWSMLDRSMVPGHIASKRYYERGITVCVRWFLFSNFIADMGARPAGSSLDRIDNNGSYQPENCRWATSKEQNRNTSRNQYMLIDGLRVLQRDVAVSSGLSEATIMRRRRAGLSGEEITSRLPRLKRKLNVAQADEIRLRRAAGETLVALGKAFGVSHTTIVHIASGQTWRTA